MKQYVSTIDRIPDDLKKSTPLFSESGEPLSVGFSRVVVGDRGPYVEFSSEHLFVENLCVPISKEWKLKDPRVYYVEWRTLQDDIKVYEQKKPVGYADYIVGMWYVSAFDVYDGEGYCIMK